MVAMIVRTTHDPRYSYRWHVDHSVASLFSHLDFPGRCRFLSVECVSSCVDWISLNRSRNHIVRWLKWRWHADILIAFIRCGGKRGERSQSISSTHVVCQNSSSEMCVHPQVEMIGMVCGVLPTVTINPKEFIPTACARTQTAKNKISDFFPPISSSSSSSFSRITARNCGHMPVLHVNNKYAYVGRCSILSCE